MRQIFHSCAPRRLAALGMAVGVLACGDASEYGRSSLGEPLVVRYDQLETLPANQKAKSAQFTPSELLGGAAGPKVFPELASTLVLQGTAGNKFSGAVEKSAQGVAMRFVNLGTGYWTVPVNTEDQLRPGYNTWVATADFARELPVGEQSLQFAGVDERGHMGPIQSVKVLVNPLKPLAPAVISLNWDNGADLDLVVITPEGKVVSPKGSSTLVKDQRAGKVDTSLPHMGTLTRDSNAACHRDNIDEEDLVWGAGAQGPLTGNYFIYVDMFDACGEPASTFNVTITIDGKEFVSKVGRLLSANADAGTTNGLFVAQVSFP